MMTAEEIASYDADRRAWLDAEVSSSRRKEKARTQALHPNTGKALAQLPDNWQAVKGACFRHTKPEHLREFLPTIIACVGDRLGVSHTAMAREKKVSAQTILNMVRRQDRDSWPWLREEVDRITDAAKGELGI